MAPATETRKNEIVEKPQVAMTANGFAPQNLDQAWRYAEALARSSFVPQSYSGKAGDCLIAIDIAMRLGVHPLAFLQNSYVVHGRPGMEAKLVISLINHSALFTDPLDYEVVGEDPFGKDYRVRAYATRKSTGKVLYGPWITWKLVTAEGWDKKQGSKWVTMPEVMFHYRAASWFANKHCPEIKCGMDTVDELADVGDRKEVESRTLEPTNGRQKFGFTPESPAETNASSSLTPETADVPPEGQAEPEPPVTDDPPAGPAESQEEASKETTVASKTTLYRCLDADCPAGGQPFDNPTRAKGGVLVCPHCAGTNIESVADVAPDGDSYAGPECLCLKCGVRLPAAKDDMKGKACPECGSKLGFQAV